MKSILSFSVFILLLATSCGKGKANCGAIEIKAPASEVTTLKQYLTDNSITATEDPRGFFYVITAPGGNDHPDVCDKVTVNYTGRLTNGTVFDSNTSISFQLANLITGWQEGIPLVGVGGSIKLYLPPSLAYGSQASGSIPANSILVFDIDLVAF